MHKSLKIGFFILVILILGFAVKGKVSYEEFSSTRWKNWKGSEEEWSLRWDMMNNLRGSYQLLGMSKNQILELLGEPELQTQTEFSYYLGTTGRGVNTGTLSLIFNHSFKVINFKVTQG